VVQWSPDHLFFFGLISVRGVDTLGFCKNVHLIKKDHKNSLNAEKFKKCRKILKNAEKIN
jgi:hypothetical protein